MIHVAAISFLVAAASETTVTNTVALRDALRVATPGTTIRLAAGRYEAMSLEGLRGEAGRPITLRGESSASPPTIAGIHLSDPEHVVLEDLAIRGTSSNGINVDDGGTFETPARNITLRRVSVADCKDRGNVDGIKLSGVDGFLVEECTIERWGRGGSAIDMVGCSNGRIARCTIRDSERDPASNGIQAKGGSRSIRIEECRFEHAGQRAVNIGGSTALAYFRPKPEGYEAKDITVERCTFIGSMAPIAFVGVDGATVRRNVIFRPSKWFMRILQETREPGFAPCRNGVFSENLVAYRSDEVVTPVNIGPGTAPETFTFERNYWFAMDAPGRSIPRLPKPEVEPRGGSDPLFTDPEHLDLRLREGSPAASVIMPATPPAGSPDRTR